MSDLFVQPGGRQATGYTSVVTKVGKGGKQGKFLTGVKSDYVKAAEFNKAGVDWVKTVGKHSASTYKVGRMGTESYSSRLKTVDMTRRINDRLDATTTIGRGKSLNKEFYLAQGGESTKIMGIDYAKPKVVPVGKDMYALVNAREMRAFMSGGMTGVNKRSFSPKFTSSMKLSKKEVSPESFINDLASRGQIRYKVGRVGKDIDAFYQPASATIKVRPDLTNNPVVNLMKRQTSKNDVMRHELIHYNQHQRGDLFNRGEYALEYEAYTGEKNPIYSLSVKDAKHVSFIQSSIKVSGKHYGAGAVNIYHLANPAKDLPSGVSLASGGATVLVVRKPSSILLPSSGAPIQYAKKAGETAARAQLARDLAPSRSYMSLGAAPKVMTRQSGLSAIVESPVKLVMGPKGKIKPKYVQETGQEVEEVIGKIPKTFTSDMQDTRVIGKSRSALRPRAAFSEQLLGAQVQELSFKQENMQKSVQVQEESSRQDIMSRLAQMSRNISKRSYKVGNPFKSDFRIKFPIPEIPVRKGEEPITENSVTWSRKRKGRRFKAASMKRLLNADWLSVGISQMRFGKATHPIGTRKQWRQAAKSLYSRIPTIELSGRKR